MSDALPEVATTFLELVAIPSPSGRERAMADELITRFAALGVQLIEDDVAARIEGDTGNLYGFVPATDGSASAPLLLCAHIDTVECGPVVRGEVRDGVVRVAEGMILGADDKAAVAAILDAVRRLRDERVPHPAVEILLTVQEERGLVGARAADLSILKSRRGIIIDESGPIGAVAAQSPSYLHVTVQITGRSAHGSLPELGRNAILAAAEALHALPSTPPGVSSNVGLIKGGSGVNVVAEHVEVELEVRGIDHDEATAHLDRLIAAVRASVEPTGCTVEIRTDVLYRSFAHGDEHPAVRLAQDALRAVGIAPRRSSPLGGSDSNALSQAGIAAVTLTGGMFDMHTPQERIAVDDLVKLSDLLVAAVRLHGEA
ncbi:M20/M25/M40 family metallo-hydrolase [uncultured Microbacterium sp.]|uniref:M20/M25/M40 family metallo-hydrolase n=1 Tax=uncultured Microbacterium sp. TaxID=191216 RepID=UPI002625946A|nr:M20/M25/M40 family metallo-hydrolase [uncultured Microbacterium sp.]